MRVYAIRCAASHPRGACPRNWARAVSIIFYLPPVDAGAKEATVKIEVPPPNDVAVDAYFSV